MTLALRAVYAAAVTILIGVLLAHGEPAGALAVFVGGMMLRRAVENGRPARFANRRFSA
jgi:preprotein translocase subunit SecG